MDAISQHNELNVYIKHGCEYVEPQLPEGKVYVTISYGDHSGSAYDVATRQFMRSANQAVRKLRLPVQVVERRRRSLSSIGSGPGGKLRFGDDMMPSEVLLCVSAEDKEWVLDKWRRYCDRTNGLNKPHHLLSGGRRYCATKKAWVKDDNNWPYVVANAQAMIRYLDEPERAARLEAYVAKRN